MVSKGGKNMLEKVNENNIGFYLKINDEIKKQFNIKCLENNSTMTREIQEFMKQYIENH